MRPIHKIAADIKVEWKKPYFGAVPYLKAMHYLGIAGDNYGMDSATSIINYFLANASTFRGEKARALKAELKEHLNGTGNYTCKLFGTPQGRTKIQ